MLDCGRMKKGLLLICVLILLGILAGWFMMQNNSTSSVVPSPLASVGDTTFSYPCESGKSAFDVLDAKAEVEYSESSFGKLVTAINNTKQGNNKYWLYSVDDKEATVGATEYICQGDEAIKWELM